MNEKIAVIGLGYVGLPLALAFAEKFEDTIGFDVNQKRIESLQAGVDHSGETSPEEIKGSRLKFSSNPEDLKGCTFFVVSVPTPVDADHRPDLDAMLMASETVGTYLSKGAVIVYESTVYPGVTEEICGPVLEQVSGLTSGIDFKLGYSPERINPGDKEHSLRTVVKVVSGQDEETLERVARVYESVVDVGVHRAPTIQTAEAAKVIENTQRDLNIALMNELSIIFDRMGISTKAVLQAAGTKWNFLKFTPGLVGGHCIGVDPYYLTTKAEQLGYRPEVILAGRRINDSMGVFVANKIVKLMINAGLNIKGTRVGILGLTFKENVADIRNSRIPDIINELREYGIEPFVHDPFASPEEAFSEYGVPLVDWKDLRDFDVVVLGVCHRFYMEQGLEQLQDFVRTGGIFVDVKSMFSKDQMRKDIVYWSL